MFSLKFAALSAALGLGALAAGGCHGDGHRHDHHAYRYRPDCYEGDWHHRRGDYYRHRDHNRYHDQHDAGYYRLQRYDR